MTMHADVVMLALRGREVAALSRVAHTRATDGATGEVRSLWRSIADKLDLAHELAWKVENGVPVESLVPDFPPEVTA